MSETLKIYRGSDLICDGDTAIIDGVPLGDCERAMDVVKRPRAASIFILDLTTQTRTFPVKIYRAHASTGDALKHAFMAPQVSVLKADFAIWFDDGTNVHKFTATNAAWRQVIPDQVTGEGTWLAYEVTSGPLVYTLNGDTTPIYYTDALNSLDTYRRPGGTDRYLRPAGGDYLRP